MKLFGPSEILNEVMEDATTSVGADLAELSEGADDLGEVRPIEQDDEVEVESEDEPEVDRPEEVDEEEEVEETHEIKDLHPFERPSIKTINEKFPDLFKTFPSLKDMYFREAEYSRIFPTIDDAKEAGENSEAFTNIKSDIFTGDGSKFLTAVKEVDEKGLERFGGGVLNTLFKVHPTAFWRAANPFIESVSQSMFTKGVKEKDESMQNAARYLSDYFLGDVAFAEGKKTTVVKEPEGQSEVAKEREAFDNEKGTAFRSTVENDIKIDIFKTIEGKDPKTGKSKLEGFSPFIRATIIDRILNDIGTQLTADKDHIKFMDSLWNKSKMNGRTEADKARIISAYLARAKSLIPSLRSKYISEANGDRSRVSAERKAKLDVIEGRKDGGTSGKGSESRTQNYNPKTINYNKTSDTDILNDNITYK
jgi:hypothetical protein